MGEKILFYFFCFFVLFSAFMVIRSKNPVYSVLFLILVFCNSAGLLLLLNLDFFALIFLIVYVGAIAVLFLFVVMMLNIKLTEVHESIFHYLPIGGFVGFIFFIEFYFLFNQEIVPLNIDNLSPGNDFSLIFQFYLFAVLAFLKHGFSTPNFSEKFQAYSNSFFEKLSNIDKISSNQIDYVIWPTLIDSKTPVEALGQVLYTYYSYFFIVASLILLISMIGAIMLTLNPHRAVKRQQVFEQNARDFAQTVKKIRTFK
jgi:NADH-ubiquinone oxidoreductase chain 6